MREYQLIYKGQDPVAAEKAGIDFWKNCPAEIKFQAILSLAQDYYLLKGKRLPDGKKFLRSTAIIKRF